MFSNYLVTAIRHFNKHRLYTFINIAGLSVGFSCAIFIALFLRDELSYDRWIPGSSTLYRVETTFHMQGRAPWPFATSPIPLLDAMRAEIPEVTAMTRLIPEGMTVGVGDRLFYETVAVVDPNFFQVIHLPLAEGNLAEVLAQPESIVLSQSTARKYFGSVDPIGKIITVAGSGVLCDRSDTACLTAVHPLTVTGVLRDLPHNTQLVADLIIPNSSQADEIPQSYRQQSWVSTDENYSYIELAPGTNPKTVVAKTKPILDRSVAAFVKTTDLKMRGSDLEEIHLTPFWDAHLTSDRYGGMRPAGSRTTVYGLAVIATLIVLVACFNFTNLATAQATLRAREVSLRKTVGARRIDLISLFLSEALMLAFVSLAIALALVEMLLPIYERFLDRTLAFHYLTDWPLSIAALGGAIAVGLLSGAYPALVLSRFRPAGVLRAASTSHHSGSSPLRTALVILQFAVSIGLGIAAIVVFSQIHFARTLDLGFNRTGIAVIRGITKLTPSAAESFARTLRTSPHIVDAALSNGVPFDLFNVSNVPLHTPGSAQSFSAHIINISPEFPSVYEFRILAGRLLSTAHGEDTFTSYPFFSPGMDAGRNVLVNEVAARQFGWSPEEALGKSVMGANGRVNIVGVLADARIDGVTETVLPTVYADYPSGSTILSVRIRGDALTESMQFIDSTWRSFAPSSAIQRRLLSDSFDALFASDEKQEQMFSFFVVVAILIACLGLFGLASFTAERRTMEIGIRKVFGARTLDILRLMLWQFSLPVLIANVIAWPVAYYYLHHWLESYAYRISLNPFYFLTAGVTALAVAWVTIFAHAMRVARANPIGALRYE